MPEAAAVQALNLREAENLVRFEEPHRHLVTRTTAVRNRENFHCRENFGRRALDCTDADRSDQVLVGISIRWKTLDEILLATNSTGDLRTPDFAYLRVMFPVLFFFLKARISFKG